MAAIFGGRRLSSGIEIELPVRLVELLLSAPIYIDDFRPVKDAPK